MKTKEDRHFMPGAAFSTRLPLIFSLLAGILISTALYLLISGWLVKDDRDVRQRRALSDSQNIQLTADRLSQGVRALQGLMQADQTDLSEDLSEAVFSAFARNLDLWGQGVRVYSWWPRVTREERGGFERMMQNSGEPEFRFFEMGPEGNPVPALVRPDYFPSVFTEPATERGIGLGFDLGSEKTRREAILRARDTGTVVASDVVPLLKRDGNHLTGFILLAAVYHRSFAYETREDRRENFAGVVGAVVILENMITNALSSPECLNIDLSDSEGGVPFFSYTRSEGNDNDGHKTAGGPHAETVLSIADREWLLSLFPPSATPWHTTWIPIAVLLLSMSLTVVLVFYLNSTLFQRTRVESLVRKRTRELDSAERKLEQESAGRHRAELRLLTAIDQIGQGVALLDRNDYFRFYNHNFLDGFGISPIRDLTNVTYEEFLRSQLNAGLVADAIGREEEWIRRRLDQHENPRGPLEIRRAGGIWVRVTETLLRDGEQFMLVEDITEEKKRGEDQRRSQRMEAVGELTGGIAHDFNNLLTVIMGNLDLLDEALQQDLASQDIAREAKLAAQRGADLTRGLLAFARNQPLKPTVIDINTLLQRTAGLLKPTFGETIKVEVELQGGLWPVRVDGGQLETAVFNLAMNARDAMNGGGRVLIRTENTTGHPTPTNGTPEFLYREYVRITIEDNGCGMPREVMERAFEPFFTTKDVGKGSGLGLSMVYGFVKQSAGHVDIQTEPEQGCSISIYLPRYLERIGDTTPPSTDDNNAPEPAPGRGEQVLVVEDDAGVRKLVTHALSDLGYQVSECQDAISALKKMREGSCPDLLLTDVVLPLGKSGVDLVRDALQREPSLRVIFMTGYTEHVSTNSDSMQEGKNLLLKPFTKGQLGSLVRASLDATRVTSQNSRPASKE